MVALTSGCFVPAELSIVGACLASSAFHSFRDSVCDTAFAMYVLSEAMLAMVRAIPRTASRTFPAHVRGPLSPIPSIARGAGWGGPSGVSVSWTRRAATFRCAHVVTASTAENNLLLRCT